MMKKNVKSNFNTPPKFRLFQAAVLIVLAVLFRTIFHLGDNIEFVTAASLLAGATMGIFWAIMVPVVSMAVSDLILGNSIIFLFTWSAYLFIGLIGFLLLRRSQSTPRHIFTAAVTGIFSSVFFYLWTNFGVWYLDTFNMYPHNIFGLGLALLLGLPFLKWNVIGNLIFVPVTFSLYHFLFTLSSSKNLSPKFIKKFKLFG